MKEFKFLKSLFPKKTETGLRNSEEIIKEKNKQKEEKTEKQQLFPSYSEFIDRKLEERETKGKSLEEQADLYSDEMDEIGEEMNEIFSIYERIEDKYGKNKSKAETTWNKWLELGEKRKKITEKYEETRELMEKFDEEEKPFQQFLDEAHEEYDERKREENSIYKNSNETEKQFDVKNEDEKSEIKSDSEKEETEKKIEALKQKEERLKKEIESIKNIIKDLPNEEEIKTEKPVDKEENKLEMTIVEPIKEELIIGEIYKLLDSNKKVKEIHDIKIIKSRDTILLEISMTVGYMWPLEQKIEIGGMFLENNEESGIKLNIAGLYATTNEEKIIKEIEKNIKSVNEKMIEAIEKDKGKKVEKIWIEEGQLKTLLKG